jgi:hypothetical protein
MIDDSCFCEPACEEFVSNDDYREAFYELIPNEFDSLRVRPEWMSSPMIREARRKAREAAIEETRLDRESQWATDCEYAGF